MFIYGNNEEINCVYRHQNLRIITDNKIPKILLNRLIFLEKRFTAEWNLCSTASAKHTNYVSLNCNDTINVQHYNKIKKSRNEHRKVADRILDSYGVLKDLNDKEYQQLKDSLQEIYTQFQFDIFGRYVLNSSKKAILIPKGYNVQSFMMPDLWDYKIANYNAKIIATTFAEYQKILDRFETVVLNEQRYITRNNRGILANVDTKYLFFRGEKVASYTQ